MKLLSYTLLFLSIGLFSCASNSDEPVVPVKPEPVKPVTLSEEALKGVWETYYFSKEIRFNPEKPSETLFKGLRLIDNDGFRTEFYQSGTDYRFKSYNALKGLIDEGKYLVKEDTVMFILKNKKGEDSISAKQKVRTFDAEKGVLKVDIAYWGTDIKNNVYIITDTKCQRNVDVNPDYSDLNPPKVKIDFDDMSKGSWEVSGFAFYEGGNYNAKESKIGGDTLIGLTYKFYTNDAGTRRCLMKQQYKGSGEWGEHDYPIAIIDDVIHFIDVKKDASGKIISDNSIFMWVKNMRKVNGIDTFTDWKEERYNNDISVVIRTEATIRRKTE